jgi:S1-C subfamily serine protease
MLVCKGKPFMHRHWVTATVLMLAGLGQLPARVLAQRPDEQNGVQGPQRVMQFVMNRRARLGLKVNLRARSTDTVGAFVDAVTPNGPAAKAGIQSGDIITKLNGKSVLSGHRTEADGDRESLPGLHLIELAAGLEPNDTVAVELRRGKDKKTVSVIAGDEPEVFLEGRPGGREMTFQYYRPDGTGSPPLEGSDPGDPFDMGSAFLGSPLAELELAPLNPDLGEYFGTNRGVLVVSAPKNNDLGLKGGDVVLAVDGRRPANPSQLLRILRSYDRTESFKIDLLRKQKRESITSKVGNRPSD